MPTQADIPVPIAEEQQDVTLYQEQWLYNDDDPRRRTGKGKEKELSPYAYATDSPLDLEFAQESSSRAAYPPVNDEQEESRRIQENLKRWEQAELQRRKAARQSSSSSASTGAAPTSLVESVSRRASLLWSTKRSSGSNKNHNNQHHSNNHSLGHHAALPSTDNLPLTDIVASPTQSPSRSETDLPSTKSYSTTPKAGGTLLEPLDDPFNPPEHLTSPFADPPSTPGAYQTSALVAADADDAHNTNATPVISHISRQPPIPRPLGLPRPKTPPPPLDSPTTAKAGGDNGDGEDLRDLPRTRWWHEWICGCSEGHDRGGDHQAGKTNPFE